MKKTTLFLMVMICSATMVSAKTYYKHLNQTLKSDFEVFFASYLEDIYDPDEDKAEDAFDKMMDEDNETFKGQDALFRTEILAQLVLGTKMPSKRGGDVNDMREKALEILIDQAKESDASRSAREFAIEKLAVIAPAEGLPEFDWNRSAADLLTKAVGFDDPLLWQAGLTGLGSLVHKTGGDFSDLAEKAAGVIADNLGSSNPDKRRAAFVISLDLLSRTKKKTDGIEKIFEELNDNIDEIQSPALKGFVKNRLNGVIAKIDKKAFEDQIDDSVKELEKISKNPKQASQNIQEIFEELKDEDEIETVELFLNRLVEASTEDRALAYRFLSLAQSMALNKEISPSKLRQIQRAMLDLTQRIDSPSLFFQVASIYLQQTVYFGDDPRANSGLLMLHGLLTSTDLEGFQFPILSEIEDLARSNLPFWVKNRLMLILFAQAGDSPNEKVSLKAAQELGEMGVKNETNILRMETAKRMKQLASLAGSEQTRNFAKKW